MRVREVQQPLKVVRAFDAGDGAALVHLHNVSGGILGGDDFALDFRVGRDAGAQITTTSATRVYRARQGSQSAVQRTTVWVEENGLLELLPDPLIPFAGSNYEQHTVVVKVQTLVVDCRALDHGIRRTFSPRSLRRDVKRHLSDKRWAIE